MTKDVKTTCDGPDCETDLTWATNDVEYLIVLGDERKPHEPGGGAVTAMVPHHHIEGGPKHFCGTFCLGKWVVKNHPGAAS